MIELIQGKEINIDRLSWCWIGFITFSLLSAAVTMIFSCADGASSDKDSVTHVEHGAACAAACGAGCGG